MGIGISKINLPYKTFDLSASSSGIYSYEKFSCTGITIGSNEFIISVRVLKYSSSLDKSLKTTLTFFAN